QGRGGGTRHPSAHAVLSAEPAARALRHRPRRLRGPSARGARAPHPRRHRWSPGVLSPPDDPPDNEGNVGAETSVPVSAPPPAQGTAECTACCCTSSASGWSQKPSCTRPLLAPTTWET